MSSVIIAGDVSGTVTLQAPSAAGSTVINLPSTLGNTGTSAFATTDASGNLGLGVTPSAWTTSGSTKAVELTNGVSLSSYGSAAGLYQNAYIAAGGYVYKATAAASAYQQAGGVHYWLNAASGTAGSAITFTQAMTLDASGNLLVGTTSQISAGKQTTSFSGATLNGLVLSESANTSSSGYILFNNGASTIGSISRVGATSAVVYSTTSDQRLKSNIENSASVLDKLMQVQVRQFDWTEGDLHQDYGFIAQELASVLSGIVTEGKTEADVWQLDYSRLTPHLVKAIQEQQALIIQLQADVAALKGQA